VDGRKKLIVDFCNVEYYSSAALGKLITLDKKMKAAKGKLRLCSIRPAGVELRGPRLGGRLARQPADGGGRGASAQRAI
jgi:hypothetical protein